MKLKVTKQFERNVNALAVFVLLIRDELLQSRGKNLSFKERDKILRFLERLNRLAEKIRQVLMEEI